MTNQQAEHLMRSAWATRRSSFDAAPVSYAQAIHLLANVELDMGQEDRALSLWEEAVAVLRTTDDVLQLAHKVRHLGDLHAYSGRLEQAESCYVEALAIYREHDGPGSLDFANAVRRMADLKEQEGDDAEALGLWRETRDLYAAVDVPEGVEEAERHIEQLTR